MSDMIDDLLEAEIEASESTIIDDIEKASGKFDNTDLSGVINLTKKLVEQNKIVDDLTNALKEETKKLNRIQFEDLPELMNELDMISQEIEVDGKIYKITGAFAPVNQIIGSARRLPRKEKIQMKESFLRKLIKRLLFL